MSVSWVVYILRCSDDTVYTGITNNLETRLAKHENGTGAKYTKGRGPFMLAYSESVLTRSEALKREAQIKSMTKIQKISLIRNTKI